MMWKRAPIGLAQKAAWLSLAVFCLANGHTTKVGAETVEAFYKGRNVQLIVSSTAGGGYDRMARTFARHMPRHLPGEPSIVVKNMPGAGGIKAANYVYSAAPKDGSLFAAVHQGVPFQPLFGEKAARYDALRFGWIGNANSEVGTIFVWHTSPVKTMADAQKREIVAAATDGGSTTAFTYRFMNGLTGTNFKIITGYPGSAESFLALEKGEVEGFFTVWSSLKARGNLVRDKLVRVIVQVSLEPTPELPGVPLASEFVKSDADRKALDLAVAPGTLGRPYIAPPDLPADRLKALRDAFLATSRDQAFQADIGRQKLEVTPKTAEATLELLKRIYQTPPDIVKRIAALTKADGK
ncbi:MAG: hypothetical protein RLZ98_1290 [Pseudomonadota bacterium]